MEELKPLTAEERAGLAITRENAALRDALTLFAESGREAVTWWEHAAQAGRVIDWLTYDALHAELDAAGVPKCEGERCRISARVRWILGVLRVTRAENARLRREAVGA